MDNETAKEIAQELYKYELTPALQSCNYEQLHKMIAQKMNFLITNNFARLVSFLYQLDISESKLKILLSKPGDKPAAAIIATMIIERQLQKIETRKKFRFSNFSEEEKW